MASNITSPTLSYASTNSITSLKSDNSSNKYKTELCRNWEETNQCRYGNKCQYAHGLSELRDIERHPKYKTQVCRTFDKTGSCPYGSRCTFRHFKEYPQSLNHIYTTTTATTQKKEDDERLFAESLLPHQLLFDLDNDLLESQPPFSLRSYIPQHQNTLLHPWLF